MNHSSLLLYQLALAVFNISANDKNAEGLKLHKWVETTQNDPVNRALKRRAMTVSMARSRSALAGDRHSHICVVFLCFRLKYLLKHPAELFLDFAAYTMFSHCFMVELFSFSYQNFFFQCASEAHIMN